MVNETGTEAKKTTDTRITVPSTTNMTDELIYMEERLLYKQRKRSSSGYRGSSSPDMTEEYSRTSTQCQYISSQTDDEEHARQRAQIPDYLCVSIIVALFCFPPIGLCSTYAAKKSLKAVARRKYNKAKKWSKRAFIWMVIAIIVGLIFDSVFAYIFIHYGPQRIKKTLDDLLQLKEHA